MSSSSTQKTWEAYVLLNFVVDCETLIMQRMVVVTGRITTAAYVNVKQIVRDVLKDVGFNNAKDGLDWETRGVLTSIE